MKKYIILLILFLIALFTIHNVYALDSSYDIANYQVFYYTSPSGGNRLSDGYTNSLNVSRTLSGNYLEGLYIQVYGNNDIVYKAGNTYTFDFKVNFNPKMWNYLDNTYTTSNIEVYGNTTASGSGSSMDNITSSSLTITNVNGDNYQMHYIYKVVPDTDLKYILFKCLYPYSLLASNLEYPYSLTSINVVSVDISYQQGIGSVIDDQTIVIQNGIDNVINNINNTTQSIINNQNQNTQHQIESQMSCDNLDSSISVTPGFLAYDGSITLPNSTVYSISDYIPLNNGSLEVLVAMTNPTVYTCFYNINKGLVDCLGSGTVRKLTIPNNSYYFRVSFYKPYNRPVLKFCKNGNQALNDNINNLNNTMNDDGIPNGNDFFDDFNDMLPTNNTISSLITLPVTLYTKILNSINGTCSAITLGNLYGTNLVMPCIDIGSYLGSTLWSSIDLIMSGVFVLVISKKMVKAFEHFSSLKEGDVINND